MTQWLGYRSRPVSITELDARSDLRIASCLQEVTKTIGALVVVEHLAARASRHAGIRALPRGLHRANKPHGRPVGRSRLVGMDGWNL
jgi:hypothetical protein